jgi:phosphate transport system protein
MSPDALADYNLNKNQHPMTHHDQELADLKELLLLMAGHSRNAVTRSIKALVDRDEALAREVIESDTVVDQLEIKVDEVAVNLLAKAPLASDLRLITVAMKASHDLERVCDEATTISRRAIELNNEPQLKPYVDIPKMAQIALEMLDHAINAFVNRGPNEAREVIKRDKEVDALNKQLHRELASYMIERPSTITRALNLMVVSKAIERIADHATNVAEEVVYLYEGRDIRHSGKGEA